jgi:regulator of protease activity HflC (stomatin/prohibitin superfamily)
VLLIASSTLFIVDQRQVAVIYEFGQIKKSSRSPACSLPPPFQNSASSTAASRRSTPDTADLHRRERAW